jgi:hypothetical protein
MAKERKRLINEDLVSDVPTAAVASGNEQRDQAYNNACVAAI